MDNFSAMTWIFVIACWILWPILCHNLAAARNRDTGTAIAMGVLFGIFAVIVYATLGKVEKPADK